MSTNQQNPVGVIDAKSGRLFSRTDHENLQRIERDAIIDEVVRFERLVPEFAELAQKESMEAWTVTDGITSKTSFTASSVVQRVIAKTEQLLTTGSFRGLDFYDRLDRSVMKRAERQAFLKDYGLTWKPDLSDVFEWDDKRAKRLARWLARHALPVAFEKTLVLLENSAKAHRVFLEERRRLAREFAQEHTKDIAPSAPEIDDLTRRLFELIFSPTDPSMDELLTAAKKNSLLASAIRNYDEWRDKLKDLARIHGPGEETQKQASLQNAVTFARIWAFHWPTTLEAWKLERRPSLLAHVPASLMASKDGPLRLFGPAGADIKAHPMSRGGGHIERLVLSRGKTTIDLDQTQLPLAARVQLGTTPSSDEIMKGVAKVLGNREVRFFIACFQAAHEDREAGETTSEGAFWYWPGRFADLLGMTTSKAARGCDDSLDALMNVSVKATLKSGGKAFSFTAKSLVIDAGATLEQIGTRDKKIGRRPRRLMQIQDGIQGLLEGGYWFPLTRSMLATPSGVDPRTYDDAFRLLMVLSAMARTNARKAKGSGLCWSNNIETILEAAGAAPSARRHERVQRLQALLEILSSGGHLRYELTDEKLLFDLPKLRPALTQVPEKTRNRIMPRSQ